VSNFPGKPVQIMTKKLVNPRKKTEIFYPTITNLADPAGQQRMNKAIINSVYKLLTEQHYYEIENWHNIDGWFELKTNQREVLSLINYNYAFPAQYAHGLTLAASLTFDTQTGQDYSLSQLFKAQSNYVAILSDLIKRQIRQREISLINEFIAIKPDQDYYIADKCLVVYFQIYEYTAYVEGFQFFPISVYEIASIIEEESPLGRMIPDY
jgi:hypothetical protein